MTRVVKFGGSSLKSSKDIKGLIPVIKAYNEPLVMVVSALYGVTNLLAQSVQRISTDQNEINQLVKSLIKIHQNTIINLISDSEAQDIALTALNERIQELNKYLIGIHCLGEIPDFAWDMTLSYGERLSSLIMTSVLKQHGVNCMETLPENIELLTDGVLGSARIEVNEVKDRVKAAFAEDSVYVVPGFYGISSQGRITLLGRGGSDYTAAVIGRCLEASSVDLWKDVSGFMSADPKLVVNALPLHHLSYTEAAELSYFGARIIHPQTVEPLIDSNIPLRIMSAGDFAGEITPATVIDAQVTQSDALIKSVTYSDDFAVLRLLGSGVGIKPGIMARVAGAFGEARVNIKSIITSQTCINILVATSDLSRGREIIVGCGDVSIESIDCLDDISVIAVVGEGILDSPGVAARVFSAVSNKGINVLMICMGAASVAAYFIVTRSDRTNAICAIHNEFFG